MAHTAHQAGATVAGTFAATGMATIPAGNTTSGPVPVGVPIVISSSPQGGTELEIGGARRELRLAQLSIYAFRHLEKAEAFQESTIEVPWRIIVRKSSFCSVELTVWLGSFNLSSAGHANCVRFQRPDSRARVGGGGYTLRNVGPRMMEKLLLFLDYECHMQQVQIPWDDIVHRLQPGSSGPCATQMLMKMRERLVVEGHMVPPEKTKLRIKPNPKVRGFVRKDPDGDPGVVRVVAWNEPLARARSYENGQHIEVRNGEIKEVVEMENQLGVAYMQRANTLVDPEMRQAGVVLYMFVHGLRR
ncbi:hypothetical protein NA56DRAFT_709646 [Hyaloscypha hepaticicola]|uniref:Uncharacterized protein n=1 Tax=Hyaloscypha hepaticicola TaxID=2082293 RepID=A0A2J6PND3_9HELO|nr:hypothetical protein NA56DRAFT_709646 [Hyaloscypha hepaticicola]